MKREREKDADARARKNREREKTQIYPAFPSHARVSLSLQKKSARKKGRMKIWRLQLYVYLLFFSENVRAQKTRARWKDSREREIAPNVAKSRSGILTSRESIAFFFLFFARRGKSRRERLLNYARSNFFFSEEREKTKISLKKRHRHFFFPERAH